MKLKVLDRLFLKGIIGPYLLSFFVVEFVLIMQFLWKWIDDLLGQGYSIMDFVQLIFYFGLVTIPMALPLTVLLSSVMVYGDKAEKYELTAMKSSGISLMRLLGPGLMVALFTMALSLLASNVLKPYGQKQYIRKMRAMKTNKLTYSFEEKVFNTEFNNYSIWIDRKHKDGRTLEGIKIYDHTDPDKSITNYIQADSGQMYTTPDEKYLVMELYSGVSFKELRSELTNKVYNTYNVKGRPINRISFSSLRKSFKLSDMLNLSVIESDDDHYSMLNAKELYNRSTSLISAIDSISHKGVYSYKILLTDKKQTTNKRKQPSVKVPITKYKTQSISPHEINEGVLIDTVPIRIAGMINRDNRVRLLDQAQSSARSIRDRTINREHELRVKRKRAGSYSLRLHQQFSWAVVCLLFLFIGGSAGAIVRKGGFGLPLLIAILFYMLFIMSSITGERVFKSDGMTPFMAAWLPCFLLLPFAVVTTFWALQDKGGFSISLSSLFSSLKK